MALNPIGIAVPFFFLLMALELAIAKKRNRSVLRLNDALCDMGCGLGEQTLGIFTKGLILAAYGFIEHRFGVVEMPLESVSTWLIAMVGVDFFYYWYHRFSHRVNFAWATHAVHHQSEDYNLAVALRQPWFTQAYNWMFYLPLALLGVPAVVYITCYSLNLVYQFWIHTQLIDRMGPFEWVFNTPSHHRVHHGTNPEYIDKNYAGILIVWDRMFGTFVLENAEPLYGTMKPLRSWNPIWANVGPWVQLAQQAGTFSRWPDKLHLWFAPPEWSPVATEPIPFPAPGRGFNLDAPRALHGYALLHLLPLVAGVTVVLLFETHLLWAPLVTVLGLMLWTMLTWAGMFERRGWCVPLEFGRLAALSVACVAMAIVGTGPWRLALLALPLWAGSALWFNKHRAAVQAAS